MARLSSRACLLALLGLVGCTAIIVEGGSGEAESESSTQTGQAETGPSETGSSEGGSEEEGAGYCGDDVCGPDEDCLGCALDCAPCPAECGDGSCDAPETCDSCPADCPPSECAGPQCGDGLCEMGESCAGCPEDCGECDPCGNGVCGNGESCASCPGDCGECVCPCQEDLGFDNFCFYEPNTPDCPMTAPGGYCDPNGDGSYDDGDWTQGFTDYAEQCG